MASVINLDNARRLAKLDKRDLDFVKPDLVLCERRKGR